jgi:hypothetical protein
MDKQEQIEQAQKTGDIETMPLLENDMPMAVCSHNSPPCEGCKQIFKPENCVSGGVVEAWEEEFGRSVPISYSNIIVSEDNPYVSVVDVKKFIRTLLEQARREERERCVEVLIRRINDMEKGITNPYKSGSITDTFTDCILWGLRKAIDELEVTNSKTQG